VFPVICRETGARRQVKYSQEDTMRTLPGAVLLSLGLLGAGLLAAGPAQADNIVITNAGDKWRLAPNPAVSPLQVEVKKGDVIEFRLATLGHGVVTLDKPGSDPTAAENLQLVLACGEDPNTKPNYVLREVECGRSRFNAVLLPSVKLQVMDNFQADVHFWCIIHLSDMWGTLKLKP
jgi:hypothetical protein